MFKISNMDLVESYMLCIDIFTTYIYVVTSGSFINLKRLLQIIFKMAGIRVYVYMSNAQIFIYTYIKTL